MAKKAHKEEKKLREELSEGIELIQKKSFIDGAKSATSALTMAIQKSSKDSFRKDQMLNLITEIAKVFNDDAFLQEVFERKDI